MVSMVMLVKRKVEMKVMWLLKLSMLMVRVLRMMVKLSYDRKVCLLVKKIFGLMWVGRVMCLFGRGVSKWIGCERDMWKYIWCSLEEGLRRYGEWDVWWFGFGSLVGGWWLIMSELIVIVIVNVGVGIWLDKVEWWDVGVILVVFKEVEWWL